MILFLRAADAAGHRREPGTEMQPCMGQCGLARDLVNTRLRSEATHSAGWHQTGSWTFLDCSAPFCVQTHDRSLYFQGVV